MKFAHLSDCHLGGWRQPELQELNLKAFQKAIEESVEEKVDFVLFTGDLFDTAFPSIEILKETFSEFKKLKDAGIKSFLIAGSHDYSVSGKTFLEVLEKAGFCEIAPYEEIFDEEKNLIEVILKPIKFQSIVLYGYPGKKSGLEVPDLRKVKILESYEDHFRILMLHTTLSDVVGNLPIESISLEELPKADYYALGHIHIDYEKKFNEKPVIYSGPTFPNNFKEFEDLRWGCYYLVEVAGFTQVTKKELKLKEIESVEIEIENSLTGTEKILSELSQRELKDKIILLKLRGKIKTGKLSDIKFSEIEKYLKEREVYSFLKNTSKLELEEKEISPEITEGNMEKVEETLIKSYEATNPSDFNEKIPQLIEAFSLEKQEGEKSTIFESRLFSELGKILGVEI